MQQSVTNSTLLPLLSTPAGSTLTLTNWQQAGTRLFSYRLDDLLAKPGFTILNQGLNLHTYLGSSSPVFLNAQHNFTSKNGYYALKNRFNGEKTILSGDELVSLINKIKPAGVFLPQDGDLFVTSWSKLDKEITAYYPAFSHCSTEYRYFFYDGQQNFNLFLSTLQQEKKSVNVLGTFTFEQMTELATYCAFIESDTPAEQGYTGFFFANNQRLSILDNQWTHAHQLLDSCSCVTCTQKLTRAYLHHLYQKTPLLAQRYLIAHNVYYYQKHLENSSFTRS